MAQAISNLIGSYNPNTYQIGVYNAASNTMEYFNVIPDGLAGVDWSFIIGGLFVLVFIYSLFRILGVVIKK